MKKLSECCHAELAVSPDGYPSVHAYCTKCKKDTREQWDDIEQGEYEERESYHL